MALLAQYLIGTLELFEHVRSTVAISDYLLTSHIYTNTPKYMPFPLVAGNKVSH